MTDAPPAAMGSVSPCFIVGDLDRALAFYRDGLGFEVAVREPAEDPFFAIVRRGSGQLFLKAVGEGVAAVPNKTRHRFAPWDAFVYVADPDALAHEFTARGVTFVSALADTHDGLRGFELRDADGYSLFFGRPR